MRIGFILSLIFAILVSIFALQNSSTVNINFLFANAEMSQALVIFISAVAGAVIVAVLSFVREFKLKMKIKNQAKTINQQNKEIENQKIEIENLNKLKEQTSIDDELMEKITEDNSKLDKPIE